MFVRFSAFALAAAIATTASFAHAEDTVPPAKSCKKTTGIVLTTVGGSLIVGAPIAVLIGAAIVSTSPYSFAAMGPVVLAAFGGATVGLGMLIPGIVMIATSPKQPTWTDLRPVGANTPRAFTFPILRGSF